MSIVLSFTLPPGKPVLRGHDHFWRVMRDLNLQGPWSVPDIRALCGGKRVETSTIRDFVTRLAAAGFVEEAGWRDNQRLYRLLKAPRVTPRLRRGGAPGLQGRGQVQMWNMIRGPMGRDGFSWKDLALYASTVEVEIKPNTAMSYVKHLAEAGYLACLRKGRPRYPAVYRLKPAMNTGPLPPLILRSQIVFDQNRQEAMGPVEAREVAL